MRRVDVKRFSVEDADNQGRGLYELVNREKDWLSEVFPGTVERYQKLPAAINNVARVATHEGLYAYISYSGQQAIGIGTIIVDAVVEHPTEGIFRGNDIDYWIAPESDEFEAGYKHRQTALKLLAHSEATQQKTKDVCPPYNDPNPRMGTIRVDAPNPSVGLEWIMEPVGNPARLTVPSGLDPFGLTKDGAELQLYARHITPLK